MKKSVKKKKKENEKIGGAPGSLQHGSPPRSSPCIAIRWFAAVWDSVGICGNQKVSQKKKENEKNSGHTWQPIQPVPTPFVAVGRFAAVWDGVGACENEKVSQKKKRKRKKFQGAPGSPYDRSPPRSSPLGRSRPFGTVSAPVKIKK
jgi:hypothetical protein